MPVIESLSKLSWKIIFSSISLNSFEAKSPAKIPPATIKATRQAIKGFLSFAKPEYMEKFLDITPGSVSVLGLMNDTENHVQLLIDEDVLKGEFIGCHPCINTSSIRFHTSDLVEKVLPAVNHEFIKVKL